MIEGVLRRKKKMRTQGAASAALRVSEAINAIVDAPRGATASEVAPVIGISRTASLRLLESMVNAGILSKDQESRRYNLSLQVFQWGSRAAAKFQPSAAARQEMTRLASQSGHQLIYSVLDGDSVVVLEATEHFTAQATTRPVWGRTYWASTTTGTLIAAFSEQRTIERLLREFARQNEAPAWPEIEMETLLGELRRQGYADRVVQSGVCTIAAPVLDYSGYAVAALGMIVTGNDPLEKERFIDALKATAATCSSFLGHHELNSSD